MCISCVGNEMTSKMTINILVSLSFAALKEINLEDTRSFRSYHSGEVPVFNTTFPHFILKYSGIGTSVAFHSFDLSRGLKGRMKKKSKDKGQDDRRRGTGIGLFFFIPSENQGLQTLVLKPTNAFHSKKYPLMVSFCEGSGAESPTLLWRVSHHSRHQTVAQQGHHTVVRANKDRDIGGICFGEDSCLQVGKHQSVNWRETAKFLRGLDYMDQPLLGLTAVIGRVFLSAPCVLEGYETTWVGLTPVNFWKGYDLYYIGRYTRINGEKVLHDVTHSPDYPTDGVKSRWKSGKRSAEDKVLLQQNRKKVYTLLRAGKEFVSTCKISRNQGVYDGILRQHFAAA